MGFHSYGPDGARRERKEKYGAANSSLRRHFFAPALTAASAGGLRAKAVYGMENLLFFLMPCALPNGVRSGG
ncbi:hypothetical protein [Ottowia massiliensis]|uniref:hypothetical protein n=1 Tax=Ottowia massiliensis TaxID=2045302 RepID=UPI0011AF659B|nr:hypothetical protein [Ottowia massiliensis]